eukprot:6056933-Amphidinium_carterae.1
MLECYAGGSPYLVGLPPAEDLQRQCFLEGNGIFDVSDEAAEGSTSVAATCKMSSLMGKWSFLVH